jgi:hypothetical protein
MLNMSPISQYNDRGLQLAVIEDVYPSLRGVEHKIEKFAYICPVFHGNFHPPGAEDLPERCKKLHLYPHRFDISVLGIVIALIHLSHSYVDSPAICQHLTQTLPFGVFLGR